MLDGAAGVFGGDKPTEPAVDLTALHAKSGQQALESIFCRRARQGGKSGRNAVIDRSRTLSITRQSELLGVSRGSVYYVRKPVPEFDLKLMRRIDELHLEYPFMGARHLYPARLRWADVQGAGGLGEPDDAASRARTGQS